MSTATHYNRVLPLKSPVPTLLLQDNEATPLLPHSPSASSIAGLGSSSNRRRPFLYHSSSTTSIISQPDMTYKKLRFNRTNSKSFKNNTFILNTELGNQGKYQPYNDVTNSFHENFSEICSFKYASYYLPILKWLPNYSFAVNITHDLISGISLASFQIPLAISFACLAHGPLNCGLLALIVSPLIYSIFGLCKFLITGPEAAISLIIGESIGKWNFTTNNDTDVRFIESAKETFSADMIIKNLTVAIGLIFLVLGVFRFGFLGNIISKGLLTGFITSLGIMMIINELLVVFGIDYLLENNKEKAELVVSSLEKVKFLIKSYDDYNWTTIKISAATITVLIFFKIVKKMILKKQDKFGKQRNSNWRYAVYFFPEILFVIVVAIICCKKYNWESLGVSTISKYFHREISEKEQNSVGEKNNNFSFSLIKQCFVTALICSSLGFFETSTSNKSLETEFDIEFSLNRELIALGMCNLIGSMFNAMPSFGGYGRSKINSMVAKSQLSGIVLSSVTLAFYKLELLKYFKELPECVLGCIIIVIGINLIEESPKILLFYYRILGYDELIMFFLIVMITLIHSADLGLLFGVVVSLIKIVRMCTVMKIQILGRIPNSNIFRNIDELIEENFYNIQSNNESENGDTHDRQLDLENQLEHIENCMIVKINDSLNFANTNELKNKLKRITKFGSLNIHPSETPINANNDGDTNSMDENYRLEDGQNRSKKQYIIFDCKNMNGLDSSATMILFEIVERYILSGLGVCFTRIPFDLKIRKKIINSGIKNLINEEFVGQKDEQNRPNERAAFDNDPQRNETVDFQSTNANSLAFAGFTLTGLGDGFFASIEDALYVINSNCIQ